MGKMALLLALAGLALGLWLGFNPASHRALVRLWDRTSLSRAHSGAQALVSVRQWNSRVSRWMRSSPRPLAEPKSPPIRLYTATQISSAWQAFWHALEGIWLRIAAKIS